MKKRLTMFFVCMILFISFLLLTTFSLNVSAKTQLDIKVNAGFDNKGKESKGLPVLLTITNKGNAFSGDLVIDHQQGYSGGMGIVVPLDIGSNEKKNIKVMLDYFSTMYSNGNPNQKTIHIYKDSWKKNDEISFTGDKQIKPQMREAEDTFLLTFTNNVDRLSALSKLFTNNPHPSEIIHLGQMKQDLIPTTANGWSMADIIVIDEYAMSSLNEEEQRSLLEWVKSGGIIVIGASDNLSAEIGIFQNYLPLSLSNRMVEISPKDIQKEKIKFSSKLSVYQAIKEKQAKTILEINNNILAAKEILGNGQIIQTTFSLGDEPLSNEKDYDQLLGKVIPLNKTTSEANDKMSFFEGNANSNELFPTFQVSTMLLIIVIIIYIIIVAPLLYYVLKRKDKREYAWWIIPALSFLVSVLVFAYGAKDRLARPQIQQSAVYKINEDDSISGYYLNSLLTNRSGDFTFALSPYSTTTLMQNSNDSGTIHKKVIVEQDQNEKEVTLRNNRYWSVATLAGEMHIQNIGSFVIDLKVADSTIKGSIKNNLPYTVNDVSIWYGSQWLKLGTMKPKQTLKVAQTINGAMLLPAMPIISNSQSPVKNKEDIMDNRKQFLKYFAYDLIGNAENPALVGWIDESITPIDLKNGKVDMSAVNLVVQSFTPSTNLKGEFVLPANSMNMDLYPISNAGNANQDPQNTMVWYLEEGTYDFIWTIPEMLKSKKITWKELQLANTDTENVKLQIYNVKTSNYVPINENRFTLSNNIGEYISKDSKVKFKLEKKMSENPETTIPTLQLKGEVKP
ncbi:hypothetical protein ACWV26_03725 [Rummeliibacillus sp. JY-2-4R]